MEFTDDSEDVEQDNEVLEEPDQINVLEVLPPKESTAPIQLAHVSNTSDNSKEEAWFDEDMFFNEVNPTKVNTVTSNDDVYFDETNEVNTDDGDSNLCNEKTLIPIVILEMRSQTIRMMMDIMDTVDIMNMVNVIEVITIVMEDTKGKSHQ
jgi:hypothetical protein